MFEKLGKSLDDVLGGVTKSLQLTRIDTRTDQVAIPYPEGDPAVLRLEMGHGTLAVRSGAALLMEGTATYNVQEWTPETVVEGNKVTFRQGRGWNPLGMFDKLTNEWDLSLGTGRPIALNIAKGVGKGQIDLGGIPLTEATLEIGAGQHQISFSAVNPNYASRVVVRAGAGELTLNGLLNANANMINVETGAGRLYLDLDGESLQRDLTVRVVVGAGDVKIAVKGGIATRVKVTRGLGDIKAYGDFMATGSQTYETKGKGVADAPKITLEVTSGVGSVSLSTGAFEQD